MVMVGVTAMVGVVTEMITVVAMGVVAAMITVVAMAGVAEMIMVVATGAVAAIPEMTGTPIPMAPAIQVYKTPTGLTYVAPRKTLLTPVSMRASFPVARAITEKETR